MSIRVLLVLLTTLALAAAVGGMFLIESIFGLQEELRAFFVWIAGPLPLDLIVALFSGVIVAVVFFFIMDALIIRPLRAICKAMEDFGTADTRTVLPPFRGSPREIRNFARIWSEFAARVEESHSRDVEISRVKSDFISTAAHQLRTPLTGIRWALEALEKEPLTDSQRALITSAVGKSHDLVAIVGTLLDISSIESGKYKYQFTREDLNKLAEEVATSFLPLAGKAGVNLSLEFTAGLPAVRIDRERMKWVLNNLIENAIRYTPSGGSVRVITEFVADRVILRVRDTGIGIKEEDRNNIFERFYRAGNAVAKENQGNGLGLYIARTVAKDHGGELSFEANTEGPGTTFILALPATA